MKIANLINAGSVKTVVAKLFTVGLLAGAFAFAAPSKADAQVSFGVRVGRPPVYGGFYRRPVYVAPPVYGFYGYAPRFGYDHDAWRRHEEFDRRRDFDRRFDHR